MRLDFKSWFIEKINQLWSPHRSFSSFSFLDKILFLFLCCLEPLYKIGFWLVTRYKRFYTHKNRFPFKIISVGNLSVGGTGKSVVVPFLIDLFGAKASAIALRGYKSSAEKNKETLLVGDGDKVFVTDSLLCGDEALMYAHQVSAPVIVGRNRAQSCALLEGLNKGRSNQIKYVILDDAYQNFDVNKDGEILLLDARAPFENGHCLPAGRLREKDYSRADIIILTHADQVGKDTLKRIKESLLSTFPQEHIFSGRHAGFSILPENPNITDQDVMNKKILLTAGIGSFDGFVATAKDMKVTIRALHQYPDHHHYTDSDLDELIKKMYNEKCDGILTTAKDWVKIRPLFFDRNDWREIPLYVLRVGFEFLSQDEYDNFIKVIGEILK